MHLCSKCSEKSLGKLVGKSLDDSPPQKADEKRSRASSASIMCILCKANRWSRRLASLVPWLFAPLLALWAISQLFPRGWRLEVTSPRVVCLLILLLVAWFEVGLPRLQDWRARRKLELLDRRRVQVQLEAEWRKVAVRRCRNCMAVYREQAPAGGKFTCTGCGHVSKRPALDVPEGIGSLARDHKGGGGWWGEWCALLVGADSLEPKGHWLRLWLAAVAWLMVKLRLIQQLAERMWLLMQASRHQSALLAEVPTEEGPKKEELHLSKEERARRKAEERKEARLAKEAREAEERRQREEVARLVEEQRRARDSKLEMERKGQLEAARERDRERSKEAEAERKKAEKAKERQRAIALEKERTERAREVEEERRRRKESKVGDKKVQQRNTAKVQDSSVVAQTAAQPKASLRQSNPKDPAQKTPAVNARIPQPAGAWAKGGLAGVVKGNLQKPVVPLVPAAKASPLPPAAASAWKAGPAWARGWWGSGSQPQPLQSSGTPPPAVAKANVIAAPQQPVGTPQQQGRSWHRLFSPQSPPSTVAPAPIPPTSSISTPTTSTAGESRSPSHKAPSRPGLPPIGSDKTANPPPPVRKGTFPDPYAPPFHPRSYTPPVETPPPVVDSWVGKLPTTLDDDIIAPLAPKSDGKWNSWEAPALDEVLKRISSPPPPSTPSIWLFDSSPFQRSGSAPSMKDLGRTTSPPLTPTSSLPASLTPGHGTLAPIARPAPKAVMSSPLGGRGGYSNGWAGLEATRSIWEEAETPPPPEFVDCITQDLMTDPVITADGHSYDRESIVSWLMDHDTSPKTGEVLPPPPGGDGVDKTLRPNHILRGQIIEYREKLAKGALASQQRLLSTWSAAPAPTGPGPEPRPRLGLFLTPGAQGVW